MHCLTQTGFKLLKIHPLSCLPWESNQTCYQRIYERQQGDGYIISTIPYSQALGCPIRLNVFVCPWFKFDSLNVNPFDQASTS